MASATGIPQVHPQEAGYGEDEPLLGRIGDASQQEGRPLYCNFIIGTAVVAQAGIILLTALVWISIFTQPLILFSAHPLLNSSALLMVVESTILLQPTHTPIQKRTGTLSHFSLNFVALNALIASLVIIEYNKFAHNGDHFNSVHGILGLITYIFLFIQSMVGFTQYFVPSLYGGEAKAKSIYKYHRMSGYVILTLMLATIAAATQTDFNKNVLHIKLWATILTAVLILVGILPRIKKQKFGLVAPKASSAFSQ